MWAPSWVVMYPLFPVPGWHWSPWGFLLSFIVAAHRGKDTGDDRRADRRPQ
jgi:hypothetical protein